MSSFYDLASKLQEDGAGGGSVTGPTSGGATTMDAISYLPTQVGVVRAALTGLGKKKRKWNMEVLEGETGRTVKFEDALQINVPNEHWDSFQKMFDGNLGNDSSFELPSAIMDSEDETVLDIEGEKSVIHLAVESFFRCPQVIALQKIYERWVSRLGVKENKTPKYVLLPMGKLEEGIEAVYNALIHGIEEDCGQLEMLSERVDEDPLPDIQKTGEYKVLAGTRIRSELEGFGLIFEARLGFDKSLKLSFLVEDGELADKIEESLPSGVQRVGNVFYPEARCFGPNHGIPDLLVEAIQELKGEIHE